MKLWVVRLRFLPQQFACVLLLHRRRLHVNFTALASKTRFWTFRRRLADGVRVLSVIKDRARLFVTYPAIEGERCRSQDEQEHAEPMTGAPDRTSLLRNTRI